MRLAIFLVGSLACAAQSKPDAAAALREISSYAKQPATWLIEGDVKTSPKTDGDAFTLIIRSPVHTHFDAQGGTPAQIVCDGESAWLYSPLVNMYKKIAASEEVCAPVLDRRQHLPETVQSAAFAGKGKFRLAGETGECDLILGNSNGARSSRRLKRTLCVDLKRKLVLWKSVEDGKQSEAFTFTRIERDATVRESLTSFEPPAGSKPTEQRIPMSPALGAENPSGEPGAIPPRLKSQVPPELDQASVRANIQGGVTLYQVIDAKGVPTKLQVIHSLSPGLDNNAIAAVSKWRFAPAAKDGKPIAYGTTIVVTYQY